MLDERKLAVLRAIVEDYVATQEPVGSRALVERHNLGVSPATIRNDMATLEDEGLIAAPHTSAGRIPTDKGYRLFVDRLSNVKALSPPEKKAIESFLKGAVDLDDVIGRTVKLLAQLTRQVAVVQYPSLQRSAVRHVELVGLSPSRLLLVLITTSGRVEQRVVETSIDLDVDQVAALRARVNEAVDGKRLAEVAAAVEPLLTTDAADRTQQAITATLIEMAVEQSEERVLLAGTANLARYGAEFGTVVAPLLEALEEHVVLLKLLGDASGPETVTVRIGRENGNPGLSGASVVTVGYGSDAEIVARLGVVGPTRMDYPGTMGSVRAVARYLGRILAE